MPEVVLGAAISAGVSTTLTAATVVSSTASFMGLAAGATSFFAQQFVIGVALGGASMLLADKPKAGIGDTGNNSTWIKNSIANRNVVYGKTRVGGTLVYADVTDDDEYLHLVFTLASHEIEEVESVYINDEIVTLDVDGNVTAPDKYADLIRINIHLGDQTTADSDLVAESENWTNDHKLLGVSYLYARLKFNGEAFGGGIPAISAVVKGKKVYDPRSSTEVTFPASANPALIIRDYLTSTVYGVGALSSEIDDTAFIAAANICDIDVDLKEARDGSTTENKYEAHGNLSTGATPKSNLEQLVSSCAGTLTYANGQWRLLPGSYRTPTIHLTEDDLRGAISISTRHSRRDSFNGVKGIFTAPESNWQPTDYPSYLGSEFVTIDNDEERFVDLPLKYTTSPSMATRLAKLMLYRHRQQLNVTVRTSLKPFDVSVGDTITLTSDRYGWNQKVFEVMNWSFDPNPGAMTVGLVLKETSSSVYNWDELIDEKSFEQDNTTLPDPFVVNPPGVVLSDELRTFNQDIVAFLIADVSSANKQAVEFEVQAKRSDESTWINLGFASGTRFELPKVDEDVTYDVRARAKNAVGARSGWSSTFTRTIVGKSAPPSDVVNFKVNVTGNQAHLTWDAVTDLDLSHYRIRHTSAISGANYSDAQDMIKKVARPGTVAVVPAKTGTYFIKAYDKSGNASQNATGSVAYVDSVAGGNVVQTFTESPTFSGTKTNCSVVSGDLIMDAGYTTATYNFASTLDLGGKYQTRLTNSIYFTRYDRSALFDSAGGLFDSRSGLFDGNGDFDDIDTVIQVRFTDDDPSGSPTWSDWSEFQVGEYAARAYQFRVILNSDSTNVSPQITSLSVTADMEDRIVAESDLTSGSSSYAVTFSPAFKGLQGVGISASNLATGDYYEITSKSVSGFTITFKNSGGTAVSRTFDYVARGYGEVI